MKNRATAWWRSLPAAAALLASPAVFGAGDPHDAKPEPKAAAEKAEKVQKASEKRVADGATAEKPVVEKPAIERPVIDKSAVERPQSRAPVKAEPTPAPTAAARSAEEDRSAMETFRRRLTERLGATPAEDGDGRTVRVVSKAAPGHDTAVAPVRVGTVARHGAPSGSPVRGTKTAIATASAHGGPLHWSYEGEAGPAAWGRLQPEFAKCSTGTRQSPIDIRDGIHVDLDPIKFDYRASGFRVLDDGHTIQVNLGSGNSIAVQGRRYDLAQFHFHRPSEERIDGRQFEMVAHLVHKDLEGRLAVVAVLFEAGPAHPVVQTVWNNLPLEKGEDTIGSTTIDLNALLPEDRRYYTYMGSLTTPPCSEGVLWMVMKAPAKLSEDQVGIFARLYPMNARPIQSASGRLIKESN